MKIKAVLATLLAAGILLTCLVSTGSARWWIDDESSKRETVVLLHGLGRSNVAMWLMAYRLEKADFNVVLVGYRSLNRTPKEILDDVSKQIDDCCVESQRPVHFVGHSLGGLLIRAYLQDHKVANLGNVLLIGTPNQGTKLVDRFRDKWWMQLLGPTTLALGTNRESFPSSLDDPYYPVGVIAGVSGSGLNDDILPGKDDGLVAIEATKVNGMSDFRIVETSHSFMRYDEEVARLAVTFLKNGSFSSTRD